DDANRIAMDQLTRDVRQANCVTAFTTNTLTLQDSDGLALAYTYDPAARTVTRTKDAVAPSLPTSKIVLTQCDRLHFDLGQRNLVPGTFDTYAAATNASTAKVVNV